MNQSQQDLRRAAAKEFMESLDQLSQSLKAVEAIEEPADSAAVDRQSLSAAEAEVMALEEAAADIEQFIQSQSAK